MLQANSLTSVPFAPAGTTPVAVLMAEIADACEGPEALMARRITEALRRAVATRDLLTPEQCQPCAATYARHIVASDPAGRFTLLSIVWGAGQFSPPHAHDTWCAYAVGSRALTETLYRYDADSGQARAVATAARPPGFACFAPSGLEQIHRLGNGGAVPALSLHVYGVDPARVGSHVNRLMDVAEREG